MCGNCLLACVTALPAPLPQLACTLPLHVSPLIWGNPSPRGGGGCPAGCHPLISSRLFDSVSLKVDPLTSLSPTATLTSDLLTGDTNILRYRAGTWSLRMRVAQT